MPFARPANVPLTALDIETTGLAGAAAMVFLVGLGEWTADGVWVTQILAPDLPFEEDLLSLLDAHLNDIPDRLLVTFNGDSFDLPFLRTRARFQGVRLGVPAAYDVLPHARRLYRASYDSCRLTSLEHMRLGHRRTDDLPGALVPQVYYHALQTEDLSILEPILKHNALDLVATLGLLGAMADDLAKPPDVLDTGLLLGRSRVHRASQDLDREAQDLKDCLAQDPAWSLRFIVLRRLDRIYRTTRDARARHALWAEEARREDCPPEHLVAYAKVLEHEVRDFARAYAVTLEAMARTRARHRLVGRVAASELDEDLKRRLERLERRLRSRTTA